MKWFTNSDLYSKKTIYLFNYSELGSIIEENIPFAVKFKPFLAILRKSGF
jgi:hypothetical protein